MDWSLWIKGNLRLSCKDRWGVGEGETLFCFVGRFMEQKGVIHLIEAVAKLAGAEEHTPPFRVLMVGDGGFIGEYKKIIADRKLDRQFIFTGFIPEVRPILAAVDAIVVPSLWEASSLVSLEAFSVGCPVIASNCIGLREVVADTPAIVVPAGDSERLAAGMSLFLSQPALYKGKAIDFISEASERFNVKSLLLSLMHYSMRCSEAAKDRRNGSITFRRNIHSHVQ